MKSLAEVYPQLVKEWSEKNKLSPTMVSYGSSKKYLWNGSCGHEWEATVKNRGNRKSGCPYCSGNKVLVGFNDLASKKPKLAKEWSRRNDLHPTQITARSTREVYWKCRKCGYEWKARIADRTAGSGCPVCVGQVTASGINDLDTLFPEIAEEWSDRNVIKSRTVSVKSRENVWWKCGKCGFEYRAVVDARVKGLKCPACKETIRKREAKLKKMTYRMKKKALAYYSKIADGYVRFNDDEQIGIPLEVYFSEKRSAIEIEYGLKHQGRYPKRELAKNWLCINSGIKLFRIVYPGGKEMNTCVCVTLSDNSADVLTEAIKVIFEMIGIDADVDIKRDYDLILEEPE